MSIKTNRQSEPMLRNMTQSELLLSSSETSEESSALFATQNLNRANQIDKKTLVSGGEGLIDFEREDYSRDEMNLVEFPLALLSSRTNSKVKTLEFHETQRLRTGQVIEKEWIITGADKFGLPTATDDDVVLGLMKLSLESEFSQRKIYFSRYELLKALRWRPEGRNYSRLTKSLDRLSGVRIRTKNGFFNNSDKAYQTRNFGIIDAYEINDSRGAKGSKGKTRPKSFFIWSEVLYDSFQASYIKKINLDLYFSLRSAVSRRLYRYLDKHFYRNNKIERNLSILAFEKLGLSRGNVYISSIKQQLKPALEELVSVGYLSSYAYSGRGEVTRICLEKAGAGKSKHPLLIRAEKEIERQKPVREEAKKLKPSAIRQEVFEGGSIASGFTKAHDKSAALSRPSPMPGVSDPVVARKFDEVVNALARRGLGKAQAQRLLKRREVSELEQVSRLIEYFDYLVQTRDRKVSLNQVGFLYRAVEKIEDFQIPAGFQSLERADGPRRARPERRLLGAIKKERAFSNTGSSSAEGEASREAYRVFLKQETNRLKASLSASQVRQSREKANKKLECLRGVLDHVSLSKCYEEYLIEELASLLGLPTYSEWL